MDGNSHKQKLEELLGFKAEKCSCKNCYYEDKVFSNMYRCERCLSAENDYKHWQPK